jgi:hypothetical protein
MEMEGIIARPPIRSFLVRHLLYADTPFLCPAIEHTYRMHGSAASQLLLKGRVLLLGYY